MTEDFNERLSELLDLIKTNHQQVNKRFDNLDKLISQGALDVSSALSCIIYENYERDSESMISIEEFKSFLDHFIYFGQTQHPFRVLDEVVTYFYLKYSDDKKYIVGLRKK